MRNRILANLALALGTSLFLSGAVFAQPQSAQPNDQPNNGGWRTLGQQPGGPSGDVNAPPPGPEAAPPLGPDAGPPPGPPRTGQLTLPAGTLITVRTSQPLSSDHSQPGEGFTAVLQQPLIADGLVVARRGQTVLGTVTEAVKAGRATGVSHLGLQVGQLTLVDGQQMPVKTNLLERKGNTSVGRDAVGIGATTGVGAAVGAGVAGGVGAGVGAGAGALLGIAGVLLTRGQPTIVYPETLLVFRLESPVTISTERTEQAFQPVGPQDYQGSPQMRAGAPYGQPGYGQPGYPPPGGGYYAPAPYYAGAYPYYGYGYPYPYYYGGPYLGFGFGPGFYYGRGYGGFYRGGFARGGFRR